MDENTTNKNVDELFFTSHDGVELFYRHWPSKSNNIQRAIVFFHRGHEHSDRMAHIVDELKLPDFHYFAWDARGHGLSPGERGYSPSFSSSIRDVQNFIEHISGDYNIAVENIVIIAQSVGAVLIAAWLHDYAPICL